MRTTKLFNKYNQYLTPKNRNWIKIGILAEINTLLGSVSDFYRFVSCKKYLLFEYIRANRILLDLLIVIIYNK